MQVVIEVLRPNDGVDMEIIVIIIGSYDSLYHEHTQTSDRNTDTKEIIMYSLYTNTNTKYYYYSHIISIMRDQH